MTVRRSTLAFVVAAATAMAAFALLIRPSDAQAPTRQFLPLAARDPVLAYPNPSQPNPAAATPTATPTAPPSATPSRTPTAAPTATRTPTPSPTPTPQARVVWATGDSGTLLRTTDGGLLWRNLSGYTTDDLHGVVGYGSGEAWLAGSQGAVYDVLATTDGSASWSGVTVTGTDRLRIAGSAGMDNLWAAAEGAGRVYRSQSLGAWNPVLSTQSNLVAVATARGTSAVWALGAAGMGVGAEPRVFRSSDNGATWASAVLPFQGQVIGLAAPSTTEVWVVGTNEAVLKSADGGATWSLVHYASGNSASLFSVSAPAPGVVWAAGQNRVLRSSDGGITWSESTFDVFTYFTATAAASSSVAWVGGLGGVLLTTSDGGASWGAQATGSSADVNALFVRPD